MKRRQVDIHDLMDGFFVNHDGCLIQFRFGTGYRQVARHKQVDVGQWTLNKIGESCCGVPVEAAVVWIESIGGNVRPVKVLRKAVTT